MTTYREIDWLDDRRRFKKVRRGRKFGIKKTSGEMITRIKYLRISPFVDGIAIVKYQRFFFSQVVLGFVTKEGKEFLFDENCKKIVVLNKNVIAVKIRISEEKYEWAIFNSDGIEPYPFRYDECPGPYVNGRSKVKCNYYTFIDEKGKPIYAPIFEDASDFRKSGRAFVWLKGKRHVLGKNGKILE